MERRLAAILSADVSGYGRLMGQDEATTVKTLTRYREVMGELVRQHRGRIVDAVGDNLLAEFPSVVDAVTCASTVQRELEARNQALPAQRRMRFRIGINLGDVLVEDERIYGDGVNIAARVESLAEPGGICLSGTAYDQVKTKLELAYESLGEHSVKNIGEPVRVYRVGLGPGGTRRGRRPRLGGRRTVLAAAVVGLGVLAMLTFWWLHGPLRPPATQRATMTLEPDGVPALPDMPSIAVLPFVNLSDDPEQEYFSDGLTEDLITDLSKVSGLLVIARNSSFTYKGTSVKVQDVGRELGVHYVLEGSVRRAAARVRVTAQLVDAQTGHHVWADRYDRDLKDVFGLQDDLTQKIVGALAVTLTEGEAARVGGRTTVDPEAYDLALRGWAYYRRSTREANDRARKLFEQALAEEPAYAEAYAGLGWTHFQQWTFQWSQDPQTLGEARRLAERALELDSSLTIGRRLLAHVHVWQRRHDDAIAEAERVIALAPSDADGYELLGNILTWAGRPEEGIESIKRAIRLNPRFPLYYLWGLGHAYYLTRKYEEAISVLKQVLTMNPEWLPAHAYLAACYSELGRFAEARTEVAELSRLSPVGSMESLRQSLPYKDPAVLERVLGALGKAGLEG